MKRLKFKLDGCDIRFYATAPEDMTLKQLLEQCDRVKPDWCACGIHSEDFEDQYVDIIFDYNDVKAANKNVTCSIKPKGEKWDWDDER